VTEVADGNILPNVQFEIAASRREHKGAANRLGQHNVAVDDSLYMFQDRVTIIAGFCKPRIFDCSQQDGIRSTDTRETEFDDSSSGNWPARPVPNRKYPMT
jgi:hypothetical protein